MNDAGNTQQISQGYGATQTPNGIPAFVHAAVAGVTTILVVWMGAVVAQVVLGFAVLDYPKEHAHTRRCKTVMPVHFLAKIAAHQRSQQRAEIDAHIENGKTGVAPCAPFGVQLAHDGADVGFQQPGAEDDQDQTKKKRFGTRDRQDKMSGHNNQTAVPHRLLLAQQAVCDPPARQSHQVDAGRVQTINCSRHFVVKAKTTALHRVDHEQHQQRTHAVVTETLPHFGKKQGGQTARVFLALGHLVRSRGNGIAH